MSDQTITSVSREHRSFRPSAEFKAQANLGSEAAYKKLYAESVNSPEKFWGRQANEQLVWRKLFKKVLDWQPPHAKWFVGGKLNVSENCLDRHLGTARENKAALIFEGEPGDVRTITYKQLHFHVCRWANYFQNIGVGEGDRVALYLPMIPEAVMAMLACARVGAIHTVIFGGFSAEAIKDRINDCRAKLVITADGGWRRGKVIELNVDKAVEGTPTVQQVLVVKRCGNPVTMKDGRDVWWKDAWDGAPNFHKAKAFDSEHPLFIHYTSGSTGKPKGALGTHLNIATNILTTGLSVARMFVMAGEPLPDPDPHNTPQRSILLVVPLFHVTGFHASLNPAMATGAKVVLMRKWDVEVAMAVIERERINGTGGVPTCS